MSGSGTRQRKSLRRSCRDRSWREWKVRDPCKFSLGFRNSWASFPSFLSYSNFTLIHHRTLFPEEPYCPATRRLADDAAVGYLAASSSGFETVGWRQLYSARMTLQHRGHDQPDRRRGGDPEVLRERLQGTAYGKCAIDSETCPVTMLERYSDEIADGHGSF